MCQDGCTTLHCASLRGHVEVTQFLFERGANIEDTDKVSFEAIPQPSPI